MTNNIRGITIDIGGNTQPLQQALRDVDNQSRSTQQELSQVERALKFDPGNTTLITQQQNLLQDAIANTNVRLNALRDSQAEVDRQFANNEINPEQYRVFQRELASTELTLRQLSGSLQASDTDLSRFNDSQQQLNTFLAATNQSVEDLASVLGTRLTNAIRNGTASADQLEQAVTRVGQRSGVAANNLDEFRNTLRNVDGNNLDTIARDLANIGDNAEQAQRDISGLSGAIGGLAAGAGSVLGVGAVTGLVDELTEANIAFTQLEVQANRFNVDLEQLQDGRNTLSSINADVNQITETFGTLLQAGFDNEEAINNISQALAGARTLYGETFSPEGLAESIGVTTQLSEATGQFADLLDRSGVPLEQFNDDLAALNTTQERANFIANLLATEGLNDAFLEYQRLSPEIQANNISIQNNQSALAELATQLTPLVITIRDITTSIIEWVTNNQGLALSLVTIFTSIGALVASFAILGPAVGSLASAFPTLAVTISALAGPISLIVLAIAGLGAAFVALYGQSETFRDSVSQVFNSIRDVALNVFETISTFIGEQLSIIQNFWDINGANILEAAQNAFNGILEVVQFVMPAIRLIVETVWSAIQQVITGALNIILGAVQIFSGLFRGDFQTLWDGIVQLFRGAIDLILGLMTLSFFGSIRTLLLNFVRTFTSSISSLWTTVIQFFRGGAQSSTGIITSLNSTVISIIRQLANDFISSIGNLVTQAVSRFVLLRDQIISTVRQINLFQIGADIVSGLIRGITSMGSRAINAITGLANGIIQKARDILDINSPSRVFEEIGEFTGQGLEIGITRTIRDVADTSARLSNAVINAGNSINNSSNLSARNGLAQQQIINQNTNFDMSNVIAAIQQLANVPIQPQLIVDGRNLTNIVSQYQRQDAVIQGLSRGVQFT